MDKLYIGIDGGGTKTAIIAALGDGTVIAEKETSGTSWREHGTANVASLIYNAVRDMGASDAGGSVSGYIGNIADAIGGIAAGLPCYGESAEGDAALREELSKVFPGVPLYLANDVEVGWAGALALQPGIHLVAGTGSIAYGVDIHGNHTRCGGWDEFYSDEGSAYWIARKGMELFSKQSDGRLQKGAMLDIVREEFALENDVSFIDYIHKHYGGERKDRAAFQLLVAKAAGAGDPAAQDIYRDAAAELFLMASGIRRQLDMPDEGWPVSYSGGVFKNGELIHGPLRQLVEDAGGILQEPKYPPVRGALLIALDLYAK